MNAMGTDKTKLIIISLLLLITAIAVYWPAVGHEFINYDDPAYVTGNAHVRTGFTYENIRWAFTTTLMGNWNPATWLSHMADMHLYGLDPRGHHLTSVILHGLTTVLLFIFLNRVTGAYGAVPWLRSSFLFIRFGWNRSPGFQNARMS